MKKMKKWIAIGAVVLALGACQNRPAQADETATEVNQPTDAEVVTARVQEIYNAVFKEYNLEDSLRNVDQLGESQGAYAHRNEFIDKFCSSEWGSLVRQINRIDSLYHDGEMGFWEADYWIMGQDWHDLSISDVEVLSVTPSEAAAQFKLHNLGSVKTVALLLVKEDGTWKIDNFQDADEEPALDWKRAMQEYVAEEAAQNHK